MQFQFDSLSTIQKRIETDLLSSLTDDKRESGFFEKSLARVLSATLAPMINYLYMFIRWCSTQMFPWSATGKYLLRHSTFYGINKAFSKFSAGKITLYGDPGSTIKAGAKIKSSDKPYNVRNDYIVSESGILEVEIIAVNPGSEFNITDSSASFTLQETIEGIQKEASFLEPITGGLDEPTDRELQTKIRVKAQAINPTGSASDYIANALLSDGVTNAWVYPRGIQRINGFVSVAIMGKTDGSWSTPSEDQRIACYNLINTIRPDTDIFSRESGIVIPELVNVNINFIALPGHNAEIMNKIKKEFEFIINNLEPGESKNRHYESTNDTIDIEILNAALYGLRLSRFSFDLQINGYDTESPAIIKARRNHLFQLGNITPPSEVSHGF